MLISLIVLMLALGTCIGPYLVGMYWAQQEQHAAKIVAYNAFTELREQETWMRYLVTYLPGARFPVRLANGDYQARVTHSSPLIVEFRAKLEIIERYSHLHAEHPDVVRAYNGWWRRLDRWLDKAIGNIVDYTS